MLAYMGEEEEEGDIKETSSKEKIRSSLSSSLSASRKGCFFCSC
jgi:hypothetical protein